MGHELATRLRAAYSHLRGRTRAELSELGMSSEQFILLTALATDGPAHESLLAQRSNIDPRTLRATLRTLETRGLVKRAKTEGQPGNRSVALTLAGKSLQKRLWRRSEKARAELASLFKPEEAATLISLLARVIDSMRPSPSRAFTKGAGQVNALLTKRSRLS